MTTNEAIQQKTDTLNGGREIIARFIDGTSEPVMVRQLSLKEYSPGAALADDEIAITAFICGMKNDKAEKLHPESYEELQAAAREVNKSFFAYCQRRLARIAEQISDLPPEAVRMAMAAVQPESTLPMPSQKQLLRQALRGNKP